MGLSSSQARLLTLTTRMHQIEYKAAKIEAQKLQMANESKRVYEDYLNALEEIKYERAILKTDGSVGFTTFSANDLYTYGTMSRQFTLQTIDGKTLIPASLHNTFMNTGSTGQFLTTFNLGPEGNIELPHNENPNGGMSLAQAFQQAGASCYNSAVNSNSVTCYAHVLAHIIDYTEETGFGTDGCNEAFYNSAANNYSTTTGRNFSILASDITEAGMDDCGGNRDKTMTKVSAYLNREEAVNILDDDRSYEETDLTTEAKKLASMYIDGGNGATKTLKQWAEDLYYLCKNVSALGTTNADVAQTIRDFQKHLSSDLDQEPEEEITDTIVTDDPDRAQWYSNIWNALNNTKPFCVLPYTENNELKDGTYLDGYPVLCRDKGESTAGVNQYLGTYENENYVVIPDEALNDPKWLTNMIDNGFAILQNYDKKEEKLYDTSVAVNTELREMPDETNLKKAEAQYEAAMRRIDMKDRKYDQDLAAIETERNAIKQEMETLKTVAKDNVERTFKLFS